MTTHPEKAGRENDLLIGDLKLWGSWWLSPYGSRPHESAHRLWGVLLWVASCVCVYRHYVHIYTYIGIYEHKHVYDHIHEISTMSAYFCVCVWSCVYICTSVCAYFCVFVCTLCVCVCVCVFTC